MGPGPAGCGDGPGAEPGGSGLPLPGNPDLGPARYRLGHAWEHRHLHLVNSNGLVWDS